MIYMIKLFALLFAGCFALPMLWMFIVDVIWHIRALFGCGPYANGGEKND